jgi:hypothetical protein
LHNRHRRNNDPTKDLYLMVEDLLRIQALLEMSTQNAENNIPDH